MKFYTKRRKKMARKRSNSTIKTCPVICRGTENGDTFDCNTGLVLEPNYAVPLTNEKYRKQYYKKQYKGV